jgi:hypothetical protein
VSASSSVKILDVPAASMGLDPLNARDRAQAVKGTSVEFRLLGKQPQKFGFLVQLEKSEGWVEFEVVSKFGGTAKKRIQIKS